MEPIRILVCEGKYTWIGLSKAILEAHLASKNIIADITYCNDYEQIFNNIEIAILDLDLGKSFVDGVAYVNKLREKNPYTALILITCQDGYIPELENIRIVGFLDRPFYRDEVKFTLDKAVKEVNKYRVWNANEKVITFQEDRVMISEKNIISIVKLREKNKLEVITEEKPIQVHGVIEELERKLSDYFVRLNRSVIVNLSNMYYIVKNTARMKNRLEYKISILNQKRVNDAYEEYNARKLV